MKSLLIFLSIPILVFSACRAQSQAANTPQQATGVFFLAEQGVTALPPFVQEGAPVYVEAFYLESRIVDFAISGAGGLFSPHIRGGRLYFIADAIPASVGNLRPGFQFYFDLDYQRSPRKNAVYSGTLTHGFNQLEREHGLIVAGYAQKGAIVITHVFRNVPSAEAWALTVRTAYIDL